MTEQENLYYRLINEDSTLLAESPSEHETSKCYLLSVQVLMYLFTNEFEQARQLFQNIATDECTDPVEKARYLEARLFLEKYNHLLGFYTDDEGIKRAQEILGLDPDAVYAQVYLARNFFNNKNISNGEKIVTDLYEKYPKAYWLLLSYIGTLLVGGKEKLSRGYIRKIESPIRRFVYLLFAKLIYSKYSSYLLFSGIFILAWTDYFYLLFPILVIFYFFAWIIPKLRTFKNDNFIHLTCRNLRRMFIPSYFGLIVFARILIVLFS